jgi:hypothetical protein
VSVAQAGARAAADAAIPSISTAPRGPGEAAAASQSKQGDMTDPIRDVYSRITGKIIADFAQGTRPWLKPWTH